MVDMEDLVKKTKYIVKFDYLFVVLNNYNC
jgi:hypothetical protein